MEQVHLNEIERMIADMQCPKDFQCYNLGFDDPCQAIDIGPNEFVRCSDDNPEECREGCPFHYSIGFGSYCHCPIRVYVTKKLKV